MSDKSERLLAMILLNQMQAASLATKAQVLNRAGFANGDIATFLGTTAASVAQQLYALRGTKGAARPAGKRAPRKGTRKK